MVKMALLVIDVQKLLVEMHPYQEKEVLDHIKELEEACRERSREVIFVRHDDGEGCELTKGTQGWEIASTVEPKKKERIFDKGYNSAFLHTGLQEYLTQQGINQLIITGMQTEYCIDATVKSAFERGYQVIIPEGSNTTFTNEYLTGARLYEYYNQKIWNRRFAKVLPLNEVLNMIRS